jgi:ubiquinol-cytochrome c reductase cytochrome b subunit
MSAVRRWLQQRTGYQEILHEALDENVPGGSRWRYVWGSTLVFTLTIQIITGIFLWMAYSPSAQTAWPSVYYIQYQMQGGWLLRGLHHFCAQAMIILLGLHLIQVVLDGAYKAPREMNFWFGLILLHLVLLLSLTGYLLPWDQKGFWATKVATNIFGIAPVFGKALQRLLVGGPDYGHHTLTRFFALHAGVLPSLIMALLVGHIYLFRRHGLTAKEPKRKPDEKFWPDQVLKDSIACVVVLATLFALILRNRLLHTTGPLGAELGAPADPTEPYSAARPEWYFLFMFQFLKLFPGGTEVWGAIVIPNLVLVALFLLPFIAYLKWGHGFNLAFLGSLMAGIIVLTVMAWRQDGRDPDYRLAVKQAEEQAERARILAQSPQGIPATGGLALLRSDPLTQGPRLFAKNCASCHRYGGEDGTGKTPSEAPTASDLKGFASRAWLTGFLDPKKIGDVHYFGGTKFKNGKMAKFLQLKVAKYSPEDKANLEKVIMAVSAEAQLRSQSAMDQRDAAQIKDGAELFKTKLSCSDCHQFHKEDPDATAPNLTGYGSREWLMGMISDPAHARYYSERNDRMPAFAKQKILDTESIGLVADWLRGEWYEATTAAIPSAASAAAQ